MASGRKNNVAQLTWAGCSKGQGPATPLQAIGPPGRGEVFKSSLYMAAGHGPWSEVKLSSARLLVMGLGARNITQGWLLVAGRGMGVPNSTAGFAASGSRRGDKA